MPATKTRPINIRFKPGTPARVLRDVRAQYGIWLVETDPLEEYSETELSKQMETSMTPGIWLETLRETHGWTQARLAAELGGVSPKRVSDWENGRRAVSKDISKKLAHLFRVPADRFI